MNVILPKELLMEQNLTWQAAVFIWLGAVEVAVLIAWTVLKSLKTAADCYKAWKEALR